MITLRPYQQQAVDAMVKHKRAICVAPAGSGKTIIAAECVGIFVDRHDHDHAEPNIMWLAHTKEQVEQGLAAMDAICPHTPVAYHCYAAEPDTSNVDILIVDECHWAGCDQVRKLIDALPPFAVVYGFTATPDRTDDADITEIIGPIAYTVERAEIQAVGGVLPAEVRVVEFGERDSMEGPVDSLACGYYTNKLQWVDRKNGSEEQWKRCQYRAAVMIGVRENRNRDTQIAILAAVHACRDDSVIVLVDTKEHGKRLEALIDGAVFVASGTAGRSRKLDAFKAGEVRCVVCTSLLEEGFDSPIASVLILAGTGKSARKAIQTTGRVLRPYDGKSQGIIYDFCDLGHGMLTAQHWQRRKVYRELGYRVRSFSG
jgi:DNA repair protein RadD